MTKGSVYRHMLRFALPIFLSQVFQQLYNTADTLIVGRYLGTEALAAVSSSSNLIFLITSFFIGTSMGAGVLISRFFGEGNNENISKAIHTAIAVGLISGVIMTAIGVGLSPTLLRWMNVDEAIMPLAIEYFKYYFWGVITIIMYNVMTGIMNALGDSRRPLYYLIFSSLFNIGLDILFIGGFGFSVWSAAVATVISQLISCIFCIIHLTQKGHVYTIELKKIKIHTKILKAMLKYGMPSGAQNSVISLANVILQSQINTFGMVATAGFGTQSKVQGFVFLPITSFNMAITTFVSQNLGANLQERTKKGATFGIIVAVCLAQALGILCFIFAPNFIALFDSNPDVIALGTEQARIEAAFYFLLAFSHSIASVCRGAGKAMVPMFVMIGTWCAFRIAYIIAVMHIFGDIVYVYWAYPITWALSSIIYLIYYLKSDWVHGFEKERQKELISG